LKDSTIIYVNILFRMKPFYADFFALSSEKGVT